MPDEEWIKTLDDGRKVKFIYQELPDDGAFITLQLAGAGRRAAMRTVRMRVLRSMNACAKYCVSPRTSQGIE